MYFSTVQTKDGGDINLIVPNGFINAGLPSDKFNKKPEDQGVIVFGEGNLNTYVYSDFMVNQSRVFAMDGGDLTIWSSYGDIDAGRGARTAIAAPQPISIVDSRGELKIIYPAAVAGSGIRAGVTGKDKRPGTVSLFAPSGIVDAGDAGIESAGNVTIAATEVKNANRIEVGGDSTGVPVATVSLAPSLNSLSSLGGDAAKSAEKTVASSSSSNSNTPQSDAVLSFIEVYVLGYGDDIDAPSIEDNKKQNKPCDKNKPGTENCNPV
jgi:hypothetical protein